MTFGQSTKKIGFISLLALSPLTSCTTTFQGEYSDPNKVEIISDKWNESDGHATAAVLIKSMLEKPWLSNFKDNKKGQKPVVIVADIENRTDEHIDTKALADSIRDELINSGNVRFVDGQNRDKILKEIKFQNDSGMVSKSTAKKSGNQIGADFMLTGTLSSNVQVQGNLKTVTYQTILQLTNLETSELEWSQKHEIKKRFQKGSAGW